MFHTKVDEKHNVADAMKVKIKDDKSHSHIDLFFSEFFLDCSIEFFKK